MRSPVAEQLLALLPEKTADNRDAVIALLKDKAAGYETSSPLVVFCSVLVAICGNVLLGDAVDDRADSRPYAGTRTHRTGFVCGVEDKVGEVTTITA